MRPGERLLSLTVRLPAALLPFAAALGLADAGFLPALGAAVAALAGYWLVRLLGPWALKGVHPRHLMLCSAVVFVVLSVLLIVAVEQQVLWAALLLSGTAGLAAPPERVIIRSPRLNRTAVGLAFMISLVCGFASAWTVPLVAVAFIAATAAPLLVMTRAQPPRNSVTADL